MYDQEKQNNQEDTTYQLQQDDEYGLPEAEYSPLEPVQSDQDEDEPEAYASRKEIDLQPQQKSRSSWPIWVGIIALLAVAGFSLYYFVLNKPKDEVVAPVVIQEPAPEPTPEIIEEAPVEEWVPPVQEEGSVTTISGKTGRYYVIVGSFIDGDMASDYANKLAKEGKKVTLIEPSSEKKFYRLGVVEAESFAAANDQLETLKSTFGQEIWIVRY